MKISDFLKELRKIDMFADEPRSYDYEELLNHFRIICAEFNRLEDLEDDKDVLRAKLDELQDELVEANREIKYLTGTSEKDPVFLQKWKADEKIQNYIRMASLICFSLGIVMVVLLTVLIILTNHTYLATTIIGIVLGIISGIIVSKIVEKYTKKAMITTRNLAWDMGILKGRCDRLEKLNEAYRLKEMDNIEFVGEQSLTRRQADDKRNDS